MFIRNTDQSTSVFSWGYWNIARELKIASSLLFTLTYTCFEYFNSEFPLAYKLAYCTHIFVSVHNKEISRVRMYANFWLSTEN